jgi:hypothetical protein
MERIKLFTGASCLDAEIIDKYYTGLVPTIQACLAVCGAMALKGRTRPLSLILEGTSGSGKTAVLQMLMPKANPSLTDFLYRSDKFTPRAFVSHAANVSASQLDKVDMLPKLDNKVLLTKELAPIFGAREEELRENIAILISVLDGEGFVSDSGMRGRRGYEQPIIFNWIGATTMLNERVHRLMSQLGTRLLFYEVPTIVLKDSEAFNYALNGRPDDGSVLCNKEVNDFISELLELYPVGSVEPESIVFPRDLLNELTLCAKLLVKGRAEVLYERENAGNEPVAAAPAEGIWRVIDYFKELARGHALIEHRKEIDESDMALITHVATSSIPGHIRPLLKELREADRVTSTECEKLCLVSRPTARKRLKELELLGLAVRTTGSPQSNEPDAIRLADEFDWLKIP